MSNDKMHDQQMIFLLSLPRSGSTMLQKMLGGHSEIYTRSEPWLMLHPLYALKSKGINTDYNHNLARTAVEDFISNLPGEGHSEYYQRVRECYLSLYDKYLNSSGKTRFLDKTPRYYEIFDELQKTFPEAKFLILYRNPMAVLSSILETWVKGNYEKLKEYKSDIYDGVEFLQRDFSGYHNTHIIRYEDLLLNPESKISEVFNFLQLPIQPNCVNYGNKTNERWMYGDPETVYAKNRPDASHIDAWKSQLSIQENRKLLFDYLIMLGKPCFDNLGYSYEDAKKAINEMEEQSSDNKKLTLSLSSILVTNDGFNRKIQQHNVKLSQELHSINQLLLANIESKKETQLLLENKMLHKEVDALKKGYEEKELELKSVNRVLLESVENNQNLQQQNHDLNYEIDALKKGYEEKELELKSVNRVLLESVENNQNLQQQNHDLNYEIDALKKGYEEKELELKSVNRVLLESVENNQNLQQQNHDLNYEINTLKSNIKSYEDVIFEKTESCNIYKHEVKRLYELFNSLFMATDDLTKKKFILNPKEKIRAYKNLLYRINYIKKINDKK